MADQLQAIVPYQRHPRLVFSDGAGAQFSRFDPYALLSLPRESPEHVLRLSSAPAQQLKLRAARIREAYLDLAASLHPDSSGGTTMCTRALWIPVADVFTYVAAAYRLLLDLELTVQFHAAVSSEMDSADTRGGMGPCGEDERLDGARRTVRAAEGRREAAALAPAALRSYALQEARQSAGGDGFVVMCALYGDEQGIEHARETLDELDTRTPGALPPDLAPRVLAALATQATAGGGGGSACRLIDVTLALQAAVEVAEGAGRGVQLVLPSGPGPSVEGFWDPCGGGDGFPRALLVRYAFLGRLHEVVVADGEALKCPLKRHALPPKSKPAAAAPAAPPARAHGASAASAPHARPRHAAAASDLSQRLVSALQQQQQQPGPLSPRSAAVLSPSSRAARAQQQQREGRGRSSRAVSSVGSPAPAPTATADDENAAPPANDRHAQVDAAARKVAALDAQLKAALQLTRGVGGKDAAPAADPTAPPDVESFTKEVDPQTGEVRVVRLAAPLQAQTQAAARRVAVTVRAAQPLARSQLLRAATAAAAAAATPAPPAAGGARRTPSAAASEASFPPGSPLAPGSPLHPHITMRMRSPPGGGTGRRRRPADDADAAPDSGATEPSEPEVEAALRRLHRTAVCAAVAGLCVWAARAPGAEAAGFGALRALAASAYDAGLAALGGARLG